MPGLGPLFSSAAERRRDLGFHQVQGLAPRLEPDLVEKTSFLLPFYYSSPQIAFVKKTREVRVAIYRLSILFFFLTSLLEYNCFTMVC